MLPSRMDRIECTIHCRNWNQTSRQNLLGRIPKGLENRHVQGSGGKGKIQSIDPLHFQKMPRNRRSFMAEWLATHLRNGKTHHLKHTQRVQSPLTIITITNEHTKTHRRNQISYCRHLPQSPRHESQILPNRPGWCQGMHQTYSSLHLKMTTYATLSNRIRSAETRQQLANLENKCERHYNAGTITADELSRLDRIIMNRIFFILDTIRTNPTITAQP